MLRMSDIQTPLSDAVSTLMAHETIQRSGFPSGLKLCVVRFLFASLMALMFQKLALPQLGSLHAGNGQLHNDPMVFHGLTVEAAKQIRFYGWEVWRIFPGAAGNVGLLSAILCTTRPLADFFILLYMIHTLPAFAMIMFNIIMNILLVPLFSVLGLALATVFATIFSTIMLISMERKTCLLHAAEVVSLIISWSLQIVTGVSHHFGGMYIPLAMALCLMLLAVMPWGIWKRRLKRDASIV